MRLFVHDKGRLEGLDPSRVHMVGFDGLPWYGSVFISENQLVIQRNEKDSGTVSVPWHVREWGEMLLSTATLMERDKPYFLEVELARGVVHRLRNQLEAWRQLGLVVPPELEQKVLSATRHFSRAASGQQIPATASNEANEAIELAVSAGHDLAGTYASQVLALRTRNGPLTTLLGVDLSGELPPQDLRHSIVDTFNLVSLPMAWRDIEMSEGRREWDATDNELRWAQKHGLKVVGGPLLEFDERRVPDWTYLWEGDYDTLSTFMLEHVRHTVRRYRGKVHLWHVAARMNRPQVLSLGDEDRLQIVASAIHTIRELDPRTPVVASFDQPWAEYMANQPIELAPMHYADALVRADLGLSGLGLELNIGQQPLATAPRTAIAFSQLMDQWSMFELPLFLMLTVDTRVSRNAPATPSETASRAKWVEYYLPPLLAKNSVQVVLWNQLSDRNAEFPGAGLFDESHQPKAVLNALAELRKRYLA
ncbi:endo-1,4-beta-xylanase [Aeoliella mucimassa]|nr:endo-1,4-beta-xylanase [Aeoliella mucimassa]